MEYGQYHGVIENKHSRQNGGMNTWQQPEGSKPKQVLVMERNWPHFDNRSSCLRNRYRNVDKTKKIPGKANSNAPKGKKIIFHLINNNGRVIILE